ncbi:protein kinase [Pleurocapsa sp. PCC 7319]|uniref:serine/threonine protein kinase n=1 Tax=Pleurocapsa sp. PCC 7319 TaxID=118161 RepID=UPI00034686AE|nr:protein kinase [Pleurocapsa sp. PCC 7319]
MQSIVGKILSDRYRVIQELSQDAFSKTYLAEDLGQAGSPQCHIERLQPQYDSEILGAQSWRKVLQTFVDQGTILKHISQHPQIPQLLAFFESDREFFLVRELIQGVSLEQKIAESLISESEAISWLQEILEILNFIHKAGVAHLNIQPSSLIEHQNGKKFLTDFAGIKNSILFGNQSFNTVSNQAFTPQEQQEGKPNFTTDIYALGKIIIYSLTGDITETIQSESLPSENTHNISNSRYISIAKIRPQLADLLNKMVSTRPEQRYQSAAEVLAELDFEQNVVTLPPPFFSNPQAFQVPPSSFSNRSSSKASGSRSKFIQGIIWSLLTLPFIVALGIIFIGINKNAYKSFIEYTNNAYQFRIKYPLDWTYQELDDPITGEIVVFTSPLETDADLFLEKVNITVEYLSPEPTDLEQYTQTVFERINHENGDAIEIYQDRKTKIGQSPARMVVYSRQEGSLSLRQMETFTIKNNQVYIAIYTAETEKFSKFLETANKMIDSWEIQ